jgi:hypothetical protein
VSLDDAGPHPPGDSAGSGQSPPPSGAADAAQRCSKLYDPLSGSDLPASGGTPQEPDHPAPPVAALANGTPTTTSRPKRLTREDHGRQRVVYVRVTEDEDAQIRARAAAAGVSPQRLLVELAVLGPPGASERNATKAAMLGVRRQIIGMATNLNQLARWANARKQLPPGLEASLAAVQRMEAQVAALVCELGAHRR